MKRIPVSLARKAFPDLVNQAFYAGETTIVTRRGKGDVAAIVPMRVLGAGDGAFPSKASRKKPSEPAPVQPRKSLLKLLS
jgi:antitoxin (DNA-binding transcriptional repressor) of toxin-antitoxin stability system